MSEPHLPCTREIARLQKQRDELADLVRLAISWFPEGHDVATDGITARLVAIVGLVGRS